MAIRSFLQWTQEHWMNPKPIHLLLLGDSGYDYRNINGLSSIIVPTVQVQSYISYPSDDRLSTIYGNIITRLFNSIRTNDDKYCSHALFNLLSNLDFFQIQSSKYIITTITDMYNNSIVFGLRF